MGRVGQVGQVGLAGRLDRVGLGGLVSLVGQEGRVAAAAARAVAPVQSTWDGEISSALYNDRHHVKETSSLWAPREGRVYVSA
jgi:hypothetical protein